MPDLVHNAPDNPEFARVLELRALRDLESFGFDVAPDPAEAAALARLMGASAVRRMRFAGELVRFGRGWRLDGRLGATVVQPCVVTLEPVTTRIDQDVRRTWLPVEGGGPAEVVLDADSEEDEPDPLGPRIDLGLVAIEALALAIPAYPRKPGATLPASEPATEERPQPFAALSVLRGKLGGGA